MITRLSKEQEGLFPAYVQKWIGSGLDTSPCDRVKAERFLYVLYKEAKQRPIRCVVWLESPFAGVMAAMLIGATIEALRKYIPEIKFNSAVDSAVDSAVRSAVDSAVHSAVDSAVRSAVGSAVHSAVHSAVGSAVDSAVRSAVRSAVDSAVRSAVDSAVDSAVRSAVGSAVGSAVDSAVHSAVGSAVRSAVGSAVDSAVDSAVGSAGYAYLGGSFWAGWPAYMEYMEEVLGVQIGIGKTWKALAPNIGYWWALDGIVVATDRPKAIHLDDQGQLHNENRMAIEYRDGMGLYAIHGVQPIPDWVILAPEAITADKIAVEKNMEIQRIMIERMGHDRYLIETGAAIMHTDTIPIGGGVNGHINRALLKDKNGLQFLCGHDGSTERVYYMSVSPRAKTCGDAHESISGFKEELIVANA